MEKKPITFHIQVYYFLLFTSLEVLLAASWVGFIPFQPVSATTLHLPVLVYALLGGRWAGAALGAVFGLLSMWRASYMVSTPLDMLFSPLQSGNPLASIVLGLGVRILFGFLAGLFYEWAKRQRRYGGWIFWGSVFLTAMQALLIFIVLQIFFPQADFQVFLHFSWQVLFNNILSYSLAGGLIWAIFYVLTKTEKGRGFHEMAGHLGGILFLPGTGRRFLVFFLLMLVVEFSLVGHFLYGVVGLLPLANREIPLAAQNNILVFGLQFCLGIAALSFLIFLVLVYFGAVLFKAEMRSRQDALTKLYHKAFIAEKIDRFLAMPIFSGKGVLVMMDIDHFKGINDTFGHPCGDTVICKVAARMRRHFPKNVLLGRLGGDEFCFYFPTETWKPALEAQLEAFLQGVAEIRLPDGQPLGVSMGAAQNQGQMIFSDLYEAADEALYQAKKAGRGKLAFVLNKSS